MKKTSQHVPRQAKYYDLYGAYKEKNVVILGASGFIGRWLARALSKNGAHVFLFVRDKLAANIIFNQYEINGIIFEHDLVANEASLKDLFQTISPDLVFNLAGYGVDPNQRDKVTAYKVNAGLIETICHAISETKSDTWNGQNIVHVGSALEYGKDTGNLSESLTYTPTTIYGESKLLGTQQLTRSCVKHGLKGVTVRLFSVYGPGEHNSRLLPSLINATKGQLLSLTKGTQKRDFTYIDDVVEGLLRIGSVNKPEIFMKGPIINLATGHLNSVRNFVETAANVLDIDTKYLKFGDIPMRSEEMQHLPVSIHLLRQHLHWSPVISISEGICRCSKFLKSIE